MNTEDGIDISGIKRGDQAHVKAIYKKHRSPFMKWITRQYPSLTTDAPDVYQQAFTILYFNVKAGKFNGEQSSLQTYLFGIGKNLANKILSRKRTDTDPLDNVQEIALPAESVLEKEEHLHRQQLVRSILDKVGEPCKTLLLRYYFDNFSMESIAEHMGYKTSMVAKKKKCECLIKIRKALVMARQNNEPQEG